MATGHAAPKGYAAAIGKQQNNTAPGKRRTSTSPSLPFGENVVADL